MAFQLWLLQGFKVKEINYKLIEPSYSTQAFTKIMMVAVKILDVIVFRCRRRVGVLRVASSNTPPLLNDARPWASLIVGPAALDSGRCR